MQRGAFHARHELHCAGVADVHDEAIDDLVAEVTMRHLSALEAQAGLYLVAIAEEAHGLILLGLVVVLVNGDRELDFLDDDDLLLLACGAVTLVFLVEVLAVVLDLADGGDGVRRDLDEIERPFASHLQGFKGSHDAKLFAVFIDHADFACTDTFVSADKGFSGAFVERWDRMPPRRVLWTAMIFLGNVLLSADFAGT